MGMSITPYYLVYFLTGLHRFISGWNLSAFVPIYEHLIHWIYQVSVQDTHSISTMNKNHTENPEDNIKVVTLFTTANSIFFIGAAIGCFLAGKLAEKYGRRKLWLLHSIFILFSNTFLSLCVVINSVVILIVGRFLTGIHFGATGIMHTYIAELSTLKSRNTAATGLRTFVFIAATILYTIYMAGEM